MKCRPFIVMVIVMVATTVMVIVFSLATAHAVTLSISSNIPGIPAGTTDPGAWINGFYTLALSFGGILAFGAVVYGGVLYAASAGNASRQSEGKEWIWSALMGLMLLAGAWLVLYTINPSLTNVSFPTLSSVSNGTTGGGPTSGNVSGTLTPGVTGATNGLQTVTITALNDLQAACTQQSGQACSVNVTSGVGGTHAAGACDHANGCKADIAGNASLNAYLTSLPQVTCTPSPCWAPLYQAPDGAIYANELTRPASCAAGASCWTAPHWDMAAHK